MSGVSIGGGNEDCSSAIFLLILGRKRCAQVRGCSERREFVIAMPRTRRRVRDHSGSPRIVQAGVHLIPVGIYLDQKEIID